MIDKVQKIRKAVERLREKIMGIRTDFADGQKSVLTELLAFIDSLQEDPVSEELEKAAELYTLDDSIKPWRNLTKEAFKAGANWQKEKEYTCYEEAFEDGAKWKAENLWKPADGDDLPEVGREVVAFQEDFPSLLKIVVAHRPNPEGYDGKSLTTGEVEHYTPMTYGKGGWNIPDVKWWLDCLLPNMEED